MGSKTFYRGVAPLGYVTGGKLVSIYPTLKYSMLSSEMRIDSKLFKLSSVNGIMNK